MTTLDLRVPTTARRRIIRAGPTLTSPISMQLTNLRQLFRTTNFSNFISVKKATRAPLMVAKTMFKQTKANNNQSNQNLKTRSKWLLWTNNIFKRAIKLHNIKILEPFILINKMISILKINNYHHNRFRKRILIIYKCSTIKIIKFSNYNRTIRNLNTSSGPVKWEITPSIQLQR